MPLNNEINEEPKNFPPLPERDIISLRIEKHLLEKIHRKVHAKRYDNYSYNRQQWIIEAIKEKLQKELLQEEDLEDSQELS